MPQRSRQSSRAATSVDEEMNGHSQVLDEETFFLINNLIVDETLLSAFRRDDVFSGEMIDRIRTCRTDVEKASSLVDLLKRRGIEAFDKFLQILTETHHKHVSDHLQDCLSRRRSGTHAADGRRQFVCNGPISIVASDSDSSVFDADSSGTSPSTSSAYDASPGSRHDLLSYAKDELVEIIRRRNETIDRLERDYRELNADCELALKDLQERDEDIRHLYSQNEMLRTLVSTEKFVLGADGGVSMTTIVNLKQQIAERTERVRETERRLEETRDRLSNVESNLRRAADTRRKIARELHLDDDATDADLLLKLKDMKQSSDKDRQRAVDVERQLSGLRGKFSALEDEKQALDRQCVQLSFRVRQQTMQIKNQSRRAGEVEAPSPPTTDRQLRGMAQIEITLPDSKCVRSLTSRRSDSALANRSHHQTAFRQYTERSRLDLRKSNDQRLPAIDRTRLRYCVLCRRDFILPGKFGETAPGSTAADRSSSNQGCRVHRQGVVDGSYECCGDATDWKPGCVTVRYHVYVERDSVTGKSYLTDGVKRLVDAN